MKISDTKVFEVLPQSPDVMSITILQKVIQCLGVHYAITEKNLHILIACYCITYDVLEIILAEVSCDLM